MTAPIPREAFAVTDRLCYLDHAGVAPIPRAAVAAVAAWAEGSSARGSLVSDEHEALVEEVRSSAARLCGVPVEDLAFVKNTTEGLAFVANGLAWEDGDRVVIADRDFPSTIYPWLHLRERGVEVSFVEPRGDGWTVPLASIEEELALGRVRVVCVSWVQFARGWRIDLADLAERCHRAGALLCVDAIQGLGVIPASFAEWGIDFAAADAHKWMCGPEGIGILYVRADHRERLRPSEPGWNSVVHRHEWDNLQLTWDPTARRFEGGSANVVGTVAFGASLGVLQDAGVTRIWQHVDGLCELAVQLLTSSGAEVMTDRSGDAGSGIVTFRVPGADPGLLAERLRADGFVCAGPRGGGVRISPHGYNTEDEIAAFAAAVGR